MRLSLCADHHIIPADTRKHASQCGGVPPDPNLKLKPLPGTPYVADAGNRVYFNVVEELLARHKTTIDLASQSLTKQIAILQGMGHEYRGDCVECALAAADYANAVQNERTFNYALLQGGAFAEGDLPT